MRFGSVCLEATGYYLPEEIITSHALEEELSNVLERLNFPRGRLAQLTGVEERRVWPVGTAPSKIAAAAAQRVLTSTGTQPEAIDLLIHTGVCRDSLEPATAAVVHRELGLARHCQTFDLSNACLGFLNGISIAASLIELGQITRALVVTGENAGPIYRDSIAYLKEHPTPEAFRTTIASLTLGSAGVAMLLCRREQARTSHCLLGGLKQIDSSGAHLCRGFGDIYHQRMITETGEMMRQGLALSQVSWELFKKELHWEQESAHWIFNHQVSQTHQEKALSLLRLESHKTQSNLRCFGNTGSAAVPLELALAWEKNLFASGEKIALLGIGSGLSCLMLGIQW